jgi:hypothetical protein
VIIKKWPKALPTGQFTNLKITQKCSYCKTVVELDDLDDLVFDGHASFDYGGWIYEWSYVCPCCEELVALSYKNNKKITKHFKRNKIEMFPYIQMDILSYKISTYNKYYAYWLSEKYGIEVHPKLRDVEIETHIKTESLQELLTDENDDFVDEATFDRILHHQKENGAQAFMKNIDGGCRIIAVYQVVDHAGRLNYCIETTTNCILLIMKSGNNNQYVESMKLLPRNYYKFYCENGA